MQIIYQDPKSNEYLTDSIGAQAQVTVRKVWLSLSEAYPYQAIFGAVYDNLRSVRAGPAG
jgi:hypothetical protein